MDTLRCGGALAANRRALELEVRVLIMSDAHDSVEAPVRRNELKEEYQGRT